MMLVVKNPPANAGDAGDVGSVPGSGRSAGVGNGNPLQYSSASFMAQLIKNLPAMQEMQETRVSFLGHEGPQEKRMAIHSSILAWRIPWTEEPEGLWSRGLQRVGHD